MTNVLISAIGEAFGIKYGCFISVGPSEFLKRPPFQNKPFSSKQVVRLSNFIFWKALRRPICEFESQEPSFSLSGPFHLKEKSKTTSAVTPLDGKSAGLFSPLTCRQRSLGTNVCNFATRLRTNVFQVFGYYQILDKETVESVHANIKTS